MRRRFPIYRALLLASFILSTLGAVVQVAWFDTARPVPSGLSIAALALTAFITGNLALDFWSFYRQMARALKALLVGDFNERIDTLASGELAELTELTETPPSSVVSTATIRINSLLTSHLSRLISHFRANSTGLSARQQQTR